MSKPPESYMDSMPKWVRDSLNEALKPQAAPSALAHREEAAWPLLVEAAVVRSFLPRDLAPDAVETEKRSDAERIVLRFAETIYGPDGVQWSLKQPSRAEVLQAALAAGDLQKAIDDTAFRFKDDISLALRTCLTLDSSTVPASDLKSLEATRIAVAALAGVPALKLPPLKELDREIELRRLLAQFERMIGRRPEDTTPDKKDRFFGRDTELEQLRSYVGVIPADSIFGSAKRAIDWVSRKVKGRGPLAVWGVGGAGKTTLISKFMLEHAEAAVSRYPFAYLDFDRAIIGARQRLGLLAEMCQQTGAQFEELAEPMANLNTDIRQLARNLESTDEFESISYVGRHCLKFRELVDQTLESLESKFEWTRPFLLVFDTFEVVQYSEGDIEGQDDIKGLEEFVQAFSYPNDEGRWPRLRLIISGRKKVSRFLGEVEDLEVGALDPGGSAQLLVALAGDAGKPITESDAKRLVSSVARAAKERNRGVQPLRLRLIGEVFRQTPRDGPGGPEIVQSLIDEFSQPLKAHGLAALILIDGILVRRVLEHVADVRVKALADPGLVVRRITPEVIKEVMTKGTDKPDAGEPVDADAEVLHPWIIEDAEAENIFKAFRREISLVEEDGDGLRHRADVRQQMLPLIRARRPQRFNSLNQLAFDYFCPRAEKDEKDLLAAAEAIYHGLWLNEPLSRLNKLWRDSTEFRPRIDPEDFDDGSLASIYLRAKARAPLSPQEVLQLPHEVALEWLDARSADLLEDRRVDEAIEAIRAAAGPAYAGLDDRIGTAAVLARLLYRAGLWQESAELATRHIDLAPKLELEGPIEQSRTQENDSRLGAILSLERTLATIVGKSGGTSEALERILKIAPTVGDPMVRIEIAAHAIVACAQIGSKWQSQGRDLKVKVLLPSVTAIEPERWRRERKVLRLAILSDDDDSLPELLATWVDASERVPRDVEHSVIGDLLGEIFKDRPAWVEVEEILANLKLGSERRRGALNKMDELWRNEKPTILEAVRKRADLRPVFRAVVATDNSDWVRPLGNSLTRAFKEKDGHELATALEQADFKISPRKRDRKEPLDGVAVVQSALDDGLLLSLAKALRDSQTTLPGKKRSSGKPATAYAQDVFAVSGALLHWHGRLTQADRGKSWEDAPHLESKLKRTLDAFDWQGAEEICQEIIARIKTSREDIPEATAKRLMNSLRRKRRYSLMIELAEAMLQAGVRTPQVRRLYAQALIDLGRLREAETVLEGIIEDPGGIKGEEFEARGLIARIYKQIYIDNNDPQSESNRENLERALREYYKVYRLDPKQYVWHGINVVALSARAQRDLAREILTTLERKESESVVDLPAYDLATQLEAYLALGRDREAADTALRYVDCVDADAFEVNSTIRQLTEVWQLNFKEPPGSHVLPILKAAQLSKEGATFDHDAKGVMEEAVAIGEAVNDLEALFGQDRIVSLNWYKKGLEQCNSVARIESSDGRGRGTGFLVKASDFFPGRDGVLFLTCEHIVSNNADQVHAIHPENARANFQALDQVFRLKEIVWSSSFLDLDVTLATLEGEPKAQPLVLHERAVQMTQPPPRLYIIGHPSGRDLEISLQDNQLLACNDKVLHYRTATEAGSSGSPVFESEDWRVVAVHHRGGEQMNRIDGKEGTYEANEGIAILAIKKAIQNI